MKHYYRPIPMIDPARPKQARPIAGGWCWFDRAECMTRGGQSKLVGIEDIPADVLDKISAPRAAMTGLSFDRPRLMGILNVTPDSFSDGGQFDTPETARQQARALIGQGADILDIGGESTRPGADYVPEQQEIARTGPVIKGIRDEISAPISIDTRKSAVAKAALAAGADMINDVSGFVHDPTLAQLAAAHDSPVCLMHAQGAPKTMQDAPHYEDVLLDVYDFLAERIQIANRAGIPSTRIMIDPGIGFGKTLEHNLILLRHLSLFHALGCVIMLGVSRKKFIGAISGVEKASDRVFGSVSVAQNGLLQGVQVMRVHDIAATRQAFALQMASISTSGRNYER